MGEDMRDAKLQRRARTLRHTMTISERAVWNALRQPPLDALHFRRQVAFDDRYIADFASHRARLILEVDGPSHDRTMADDARRTAWFAAHGYRVVRLTNHEVATAFDLTLTLVALLADGQHDAT